MRLGVTVTLECRYQLFEYYMHQRRERVLVVATYIFSVKNHMLLVRAIQKNTLM